MTDESDKQPAEPRPYWKRSILWDFEAAIRKRITEKQSYPQIHDALKLAGKISVRRLAQFCVEQLGIHSLRPSRHDRTRPAADKESATAGSMAELLSSSESAARRQCPPASTRSPGSISADIDRLTK